MNKILYILVIVLFTAVKGFGQGLVITDSTTSPSICFNDGSIQVNATGGTGPYTFSVISGPSYPNITYPIVLAPLATTFITMPSGQFTIKVVDASSNIAFATATVGGNYRFPTVTTSIDADSCIVVSVQGGKGPYLYSISAVSTGSGFGPYQSSDTFCVCTGHYWVRVMDSCSNIYTSGRINISINTPAITLTCSNGNNYDTIYTQIIVAGAKPYSFHLKNGIQSLTNNTGTFVINKACPPDTVIITDRCGNSAEWSIDPHPLVVNGVSDCNVGTAVVSIGSSAIAPFTISGSGGSITTHNYVVPFSSLPIGANYSFNVTDSCGHFFHLVLNCDTQRIDTSYFYNVCPFDSAMHMRRSPINYCFPIIVTCLTCSPVQVDTLHSLPSKVFANIDTGITYRIRIQDSCGFSVITQYVNQFAGLAVYDSIMTCSDFMMKSTPPIFVPPIHYSVFHGASMVDSATANDPIFFHEPTGSVLVIATHPLCYAGHVSLNLPTLGGRCAVPMFDSSCTRSYAILQSYINSPEVFTLVNTTTGSVYPQHVPRTGPTSLYFANVPVGNYNLVSDSGCSVPYTLPPYQFSVSASYLTQCTGQSVITAATTPPIFNCFSGQRSYYGLYKDNVYQQSNTSGSFTVNDTGYYVIRLFLSNTSIFIFPASYDTICPLDTVKFYVAVTPIPNITTVQQEVCGANTPANIPYTIFGGSPPYTVQIIGHPTRTVSGHSDTFPNVLPGIYTMVVSDNCGISRSYSVSVVDTCSTNCITQSHFTLSDTIICRNANVGLHNQSIAASHYKWLVNGAAFAYNTDTSFATTVPGRYTVMLYAYIGSCKDSSSQSFVVEDTLRQAGITDTFLCLPFNLKLNSHNSHSLWPGNVRDSAYSISSQGIYWVELRNSCGVKRDSFHVAAKQSPVFSLGSLNSSICDDRPDSTVLTAALADSSLRRVIFNWSNGYIDSGVYSSQIIIYQAGAYQVMVSDSFCPQMKSITIAKAVCDSLCFTDIGMPDAFSPNGDGKNDTFQIRYICTFDPFLMHIYNRWGEKIFESTDIDKGWDGRYRGIEQPPGIYWYWLSLSIQGKKPSYRAGTLMLMR